MTNDILKDWLFSVPVELREQLIREHTGTSLSYLYKRLYDPNRDMPTFKMPIAVGLDKASRGVVDFRDLIKDAELVDWGYVRRKLARTRESTDRHTEAETA